MAMTNSSRTVMTTFFMENLLEYYSHLHEPNLCLKLTDALILVKAIIIECGNERILRR